MSDMETHPHSVKPYLLVFGGLAILTGTTVWLSYLGLPHKTAILIASLIALTKCSLIAAFFMHLRFEKKGIYAILFTALFFVGVLIFALIPDIGIVK
jgi:cytochrome c oxidase subunit 4